MSKLSFKGLNISLFFILQICHFKGYEYKSLGLRFSKTFHLNKSNAKFLLVLKYNSDNENMCKFPKTNV